MKKVILKLFLMLLALSIGRATAVSRENVRTMSKFSLIGGLASGAGLWGYTAYLNKAIESAHTPEEKAALIDQRNFIKKLLRLAAVVAAGGGVGMFATRGEENVPAAGPSQNSALVLPGAVAGQAAPSVDISLKQPGDVASLKPVQQGKKVRFAAASGEPRNVALSASAGSVGVAADDAQLPYSLQQLPQEPGEVYVSAQAAQELISSVLGGPEKKFSPRLFAEAQVAEIQKLSTRDLQCEGLYNALWNLYMMEGRVLSRDKCRDVEWIYSNFAERKYGWDWRVLETYPARPSFHDLPMLPQVLRLLPWQDGQSHYNCASVDGCKALVASVLGDDVPFDAATFANRQINAITEYVDSNRPRGTLASEIHIKSLKAGHLRAVIFNALVMQKMLGDEYRDGFGEVLQIYGDWAGNLLEMEVEYDHRLPGRVMLTPVKQ